MKKVLHILNSLLPSGAETMLVTSAELWKGYEKHVLATQEELGSYADEFEKAGYTVHHIFGFQKHRLIRSLMKKEKFDVVHVHTEASSEWYSLDAKLSGVKRIVRTVHNVFCSKQKNPILFSVSRLRRYMRRHFETDFLGVKYVAIGSSVYDNELNMYGNKCKLIGNWCDEKVFVKRSLESKITARKALEIKEDVFCILTVGNCNKIKNHSLLIDALYRMCKRIPDADVLYIHVGNGTEESAERLLAESLGVNDIIRFEGRRNPLEYYNAADLYVMPSLFEGLGISALEAARCNVPILLTDVDGLKDFKVIEDDDLVYSSLDVEEFTCALIRAYDRWKNDHSQCMCQISDKLDRYFNMESSVKKYLSVYDD